MMVDVYHSGDQRQPKAPFLLVAAGAEGSLPPHPAGSAKKWVYWKAVPVASIAVKADTARQRIALDGFYIQ
jgi:hypothetical protein